jgi:geranylgeranyl diphosphate synthase, type II
MITHTTVRLQTDPAPSINSLRRLVDEALPHLADKEDLIALREPVEYVLASTGKRLRPILVLLSAGVGGVAPERALNVALATETFHVFTLVHDDIMDRSATRRGLPTVHSRWDESTAILVGDFLLALSYDLLASAETGDLRQMLGTFHRMVGRLCEGQALDKAFETRLDVTLEEYLAMIDCKTGALVSCSLELGAIAGDLARADRAALVLAGHHVGRAFQIQDDLLDLTASSEAWGKPVGGDLIEGKKAFLLLSALEAAQGEDRTFFERIAAEGARPEDVPRAREVFERIGTLDLARQAVEDHSHRAMDALNILPAGESRDGLIWVVERMMQRVH